MADNFSFDISCAPLDLSLMIAFMGSPSGKATHWKKETTPKDRLIFAWHEIDDFIPFPVTIDAILAEEIVKRWLAEDVEYGIPPDHDGRNGQSWRVYNEAWGKIDGRSYTFVAIEPVWAMYGSRDKRGSH